MEGFQHCAHCRSLITDRGEAVGHHLIDCADIDTTDEIIEKLYSLASTQDKLGNTAILIMAAQRLRRLYAIVLEVSTEEPR